MLQRSAIKKKLVQCVKCEEGKLSICWKKINNEPYCRYHASMATVKKQVSINKERHDKLDKFYKYIHEKFKYTCQETGKILTYSNKHAAHILPKSKYDYFEFDERNAILVSWSTHSIIDKGSPQQRKELKIWKHIQSVRKTLLEEVGLTFDEKHWELITF